MRFLRVVGCNHVVVWFSLYVCVFWGRGGTIAFASNL